MAEWGAMIVNDQGNVMVTPQYSPMALYRKVSVSSSGGSSGQTATASITLPNSWAPVLPFVGTSKPGQGGVAISVSRSGNVVNFTGFNMYNSSFTMNCFLFTQFDQPMPASRYGMAIWDASGRLILTHETRVLTDINNVGVQGSGSAGLNINTTRAGRYAVSPELSGVVYYRDLTGGLIIPMPTAFEASFDGTNTFLRSAPMRPVSGLQQVGGTSFDNSMKVINIDNYL